MLPHSLVVSQALTLLGYPANIQSIAKLDETLRGHWAHTLNSAQKYLAMSEVTSASVVKNSCYQKKFVDLLSPPSPVISRNQKDQCLFLNNAYMTVIKWPQFFSPT